MADFANLSELKIHLCHRLNDLSERIAHWRDAFDRDAYETLCQPTGTTGISDLVAERMVVDHAIKVIEHRPNAMDAYNELFKGKEIFLIGRRQVNGQLNYIDSRAMVYYGFYIGKLMKFAADNAA